MKKFYDLTEGEAAWIKGMREIKKVHDRMGQVLELEQMMKKTVSGEIEFIEIDEPKHGEQI